MLTVSILFTNLSGNEDYPHIAVVHTDEDHQMWMGVTEKAAANIFYMNRPDIFDFLIFYTTFNPLLNMQQGLPVKHTIEGINRDGVNPYGPPSAWGSQGNLIGAAKMCHIDQYPLNPDDTMSFPLAGLSSIELLAHEMGHYWHAAMNFKKEGMSEEHTGLRGWEDGANQHWSNEFNSGPSVMYGSHIVDNEDGTFTYFFDTPRKFGPLDQYVMGLIPPEELGELFFLCSSPDIENCREGNPALPAGKTSSPRTRDDVYKHTVTVEDIVRAMGERKPHYNDAPKHFNIGFILVNKHGVTPFPEQLEKLDKIRKRYEEWWEWATDGRSTICTRLDGDCTGDDEFPDDDISDDSDNEYYDEDYDEESSDEDSFEKNDDFSEVPDEIQEAEDVEKQDDTVEEIPDETLEKEYADESGCSCSFIL